uniref:Uncharacterized protein n=1 Tax=Anguilla anguilla TaxID=7936 RepID=A0A0E9PN29_ANGAN
MMIGVIINRNLIPPSRDLERRTFCQALSILIYV